ncbi:hypothetical protein Hypma_015057 [Hypsizygus marmoreus]|uniref:Uncharacterized protein n=1 Tax=Hypsizygus marmoreus TaxID=39966 RepID=A0A369K538_HYPMA|nr:hypothetical protein Hypma_015057 [Hypsizygus marmoreus]
MNSYPNIVPTQFSPTLTNGPAAPDAWKMSYTDVTDVLITAPDWALSPITPQTCSPSIENVPAVMPNPTICETQADTKSEDVLSFPDAIFHEIGAIHDSPNTDQGHNVAESTPSFC